MTNNTYGIYLDNSFKKENVQELTNFILEIVNSPAADKVKIYALKAISGYITTPDILNMKDISIDMDKQKEQESIEEEDDTPI